MIKLSEICKTTQGVQISKSEQSSKIKEGYIRYLYISDLLNDNNLKFVKDIYPDKIVSENDLVVANTGSPGKVFLGKKGVLSNNLFRLSFDNTVVEQKYLFYILSSSIFQNQLQVQLKGGIQQHLGHATMGIQKIPLPPLSEQKRIADLLDTADKLRQKDKALLEKYDQLAQSLFLEMFGDPVKNEKGWEKVELSSISKISSGSTPSRENEENFIGKIPWVKTGEVNGKVILETEENISDTALSNSSCKLYPINSVIIAMYGQGKTRGQIGILGIEASTNQACAVILPSEKFNSIFLFKQLSQCYHDLRELGRGGNQPNLSAGLIKSYNIILPPIQLQNEFAEQIQLIEQQKELAKKNLEKSEELFGALMWEVFGG